MSGKYTRLDMIGAINLFCIKNGLSITYIEKRKKSELEQIILHNNINVDELRFEAKQQELNVSKGFENIRDRIQMLISLLNDEQKAKYFAFCDSQKSN
jgi:hypothetical protein